MIGKDGESVCMGNDNYRGSELPNLVINDFFHHQRNKVRLVAIDGRQFATSLRNVN